MESVGHLASGLAHDLNNILAPILMAAPMIREAVRTPSVLKIVDIVEANACRGADIIKQLLIFGRGAGTESRLAPLQLRSLLRDMESIIEETFPKNIRFQSDSSPEPWLVNGDITQMHQVLMNLCVNGRDAMPAGGTLSLALENVLVDPASAKETPGVPPGPHVVLSVTDSGTGIATEYLDKIFDPFFTTKTVGQGTGLGLSTVLGIVKTHRGVIQVKSQIGRGTQFKVYLPAQEAPTPPPAAAIAQRTPLGQGELVLLVDDEASIRLTTRQALENNGYWVTVAGDGVEGLARYRQFSQEVRVVVTDLVMPFMDGPTFIRELRRVNSEALVIVVSGCQLEDDLPGEVGVPVQAYLSKPFSTEALLEVLYRVLHPQPAGPDRPD
jgi:CheY-like chemotaxis protein